LIAIFATETNIAMVTEFAFPPEILAKITPTVIAIAMKLKEIVTDLPELFVMIHFGAMEMMFATV